MTIREWMKDSRIDGLDLMTGGGYVKIFKPDFAAVLDGKYVTAHLGWSDSEYEMNPEEFLDLEPSNYDIRDGILCGIV